MNTITVAAGEVCWNGLTVWVNGRDGCCIGRFSRHGVDVHFDAQTQMKTGRQCLACTHSEPSSGEWTDFVRHMADVNAAVPDAARPQWLPVPSDT